MIVSPDDPHASIRIRAMLFEYFTNPIILTKTPEITLK